MKHRGMKFILHTQHAYQLLDLHKTIRDEIHCSVSYGDWLTPPSIVVWNNPDTGSEKDWKVVEEMMKEDGWEYRMEEVY